MSRALVLATVLFATVLFAMVLTGVAAAESATGEAVIKTVRFAAFNVWELSRGKLDEVDAEGRGTNPQLRSAAEVLQRLRPDVVLINEIDFDAVDRANARLFLDRYLRYPQAGQEPLDYPHVFFAPVNTGVPTGFDLNNDGENAGPDDGYGFGHYPGQYGMALLSRLPLDREGARTFQHFLWRDMPGSLLPDGRGGRPAWYGAEETAVLRLSSKSHWDVPVAVDGVAVHVLASHPTPPVFDGEEDRNGRRNFDEIRLWADYLTGGDAAAYLVDDAGERGGLTPDAPFVILGDLNADRFSDQGAAYGQPAIRQLLEHPRVHDPFPTGPGGVHEERPYAGRSESRTSEYGRLDYALVSHDLAVVDSGVFWPAPGDPLRRLVEGPTKASDHSLVWVDVTVPARASEPSPPAQAPPPAARR